jgi:signal peptidase I
MAAKKPAAPEVSDKQLAKLLKPQSSESIRDTIEAVAIAFIMAFVFKTFEAELYVIPTGSMAPTLYGRHKEVLCDGCQYRYTVGASHEVDQDTGVVVARLSSSDCPNCRYPNDILNAPVFNGDRILVNKQSRSYDRFDIVVFKNPEEPHVNYIKRCIGKPGETIRIHQGDIFARTGDSEAFRVQRKRNLDVQRDIQISVYDDRFPPRPLLDAGAEERWVPAKAVARDQVSPQWLPTENAWTPDRQNRTYDIDSIDNQLHWLRYRHLVPSRENWRELTATGRLTSAVTPALIADFCGFNSYDMVPPLGNRFDGELYWVGDLTLNATVNITNVADDAILRLELVEGFRTFTCDISVPSGVAEIRVTDRQIDHDESEGSIRATVDTGVTGAGEYRFAFANVDERLCLWVNDTVIPLGDGVEFNKTLMPDDPTEADLTPAGFATKNLSATVSGLLIERDIYYRNDTLRFDPADVRTSPPGLWHPTIDEVPERDVRSLAATLRSPSAYADLYLRLTTAQLNGNERYFTYTLADDEYMMCGDNSPASQDSRLFRYYGRPNRGISASRFAVRRQDLIGEAMFIFWPHGVPFLNGGEGFAVLNHKEMKRNRTGRPQVVRGDYPAWRFPFYPDFSRMKRIR